MIAATSESMQAHLRSRSQHKIFTESEHQTPGSRASRMTSAHTAGNRRSNQISNSSKAKNVVTLTSEELELF